MRTLGRDQGLSRDTGQTLIVIFVHRTPATLALPLRYALGTLRRGGQRPEDTRDCGALPVRRTAAPVHGTARIVKTLVKVSGR
jgi:hypothetical protein